MQLKLLRKKYSTKKYYKKQFFLTLNTLYRKHIEMVPQGNSYFIRTLLQFYQGKTRCMQNQVSMNYESQSMTGFHGLPDPEADRSKLVWDFKKILVLVRSGPRYSNFYWSWSGPVRSESSIFYWFWSGSNFVLVLVRSYDQDQTARSGSSRFGAWIPGLWYLFQAVLFSMRPKRVFRVFVEHSFKNIFRIGVIFWVILIW